MMVGAKLKRKGEIKVCNVMVRAKLKRESEGLRAEGRCEDESA